MNGQEFRCHPSIIIAKSWHVLVVTVLVLLGELPEVLLDGDGSLETDLPIAAMLIVAAVLAVLAIYIITRFFAWRRTYVSIVDGNLIYDKRTLIFQRKVNVRLSRISAVNLQKGIADRIFGTFTLKLDIDSSVTAEKTDFHLVFKEDFARTFAAQIMDAKQAAITGESPSGPPAVFPAESAATPILRFKLSNILLHSLLMTSVWGIIVFGALLSGAAIPFIEISPLLYPVVLLAGLPVAFLISLISSVIKNILLYYNFTVAKTDRELVVTFGLITRRSFRLPLSKTNAVVVRQSFFGRLFGMYYAEILNVGMGDRENKIAPVFCLMLNKEQMEWVLNATVPEFAGALSVERSPKAAFLPVLIKGLFWVLFPGCGLIAAGIASGVWNLAAVSLAVLTGVWLLLSFAAYQAKGLRLGEDKLTVADGVLNRRIIIVPYSKVQSIQLKRGPVSSALGLRHGAVQILSAAQNQHNPIGYFPTDRFRLLNEKTEAFASTDWRNEF